MYIFCYRQIFPNAFLYFSWSLENITIFFPQMILFFKVQSIFQAL